ncbi:DNA polymerase III subunit alpha [Tessaracoccus antarcticus]|uniref:DNA polymerase III subunit alpha n=1 Tax=Tessaracoccus antarcticus TaxID=2479848 RepID=A0A3M0G3X6_9ACTN|nr:DNA polymerase III subunit alpha [Tessaracoccus antarcticus]RMB59680.1 DNA polymerase III subunit alpha [Tessaracoccus antarcticus]
MTDQFSHLRVASGYSFQYGASHPRALVAAAADFGMDTLALTDRNGLYGAVRFAKACLKSGIAPIIGVDLAVGDGRPQTRRPTAAKGGQLRDLRLPRVVVTATSRAGWATLCALITDAHLSGDRGDPVVTPELVFRHCAGRDVVVTLGADSDVGNLLAENRFDDARRRLSTWRDALGSQVVLAVTNHHVGGRGATSAHHAAGILRLASGAGVRSVLTNMVRMARREQAATVDVLDATRRLVPLDLRNIDRRNAEGHLKPAAAMAFAAQEAALLAGEDPDALLHRTRELAMECVLDPIADIGLGEIRLPEFETLGTTTDQAPGVLRARCEAGLAARFPALGRDVSDRLEDELAVIGKLGFESYFLTVADVVQLIRDLGIRCAARGSGAGSLVNYALGVSGVDPMAHGLLMERFLSPLRQALPDIDLDVESHRRTEIYEKVLETFGGQRVSCVAMLETYRVRHAVRDVGAALSLPPAEVDAMAKAFPHVRARDAKAALRDLPELRAAGLGEQRLEVLFTLVESLDGLPRHIALHPCGVLLSDSSLGQRTPMEASHGGFPMSQFDKDDVEDLGFLKLDVLGIRMQSSMAHALAEIDRTQPPGPTPDIDALAPFDDPATYDMIAHRATLGCFQIESPGQRELVGKFGPETFHDIIIDISLFRPGPVKSDMVTPFLEARQGWRKPEYLHASFIPALEQTGGVVVFHEQVIMLISIATGCSLAQGDEVRRALGDKEGQEEVRQWLWPRARERGYEEVVIEQLWHILVAFASFGFCKAHAAAFALPTYQSAWLKRHYPAHFISGILTHDPGMYPKRLLLEEARRMGVQVLGLDVNHSGGTYHVERLDGEEKALDLDATALPPAWRSTGDSAATGPPGSRVSQVAGVGKPTATTTDTIADGAHTGVPVAVNGLPVISGWGIRLSLADVKGMGEAEIGRIVAGQPYASLSDFWSRAAVEYPVVERLILAGAFDKVYGIGRHAAVARRDQVTRRDLLLALADLHRMRRYDDRARSRAGGRRRMVLQGTEDPGTLARAQSQKTRVPVDLAVQGAFDFTEGDEVSDVVATGLPEMDDDQRLHSELEILGLDASQHIMERYLPFLRAFGATSSQRLMQQRNRSEVFVCGVKVATQTPPVRSGRRVVFLTLDDSTGPTDATFFEDAQGPYASTVFNSWMLMVRGTIRRTGPRGLSIRATGAWDLGLLYDAWRGALDVGANGEEALAAVREIVDAEPIGFGPVGEWIPDDWGEKGEQERRDARASHRRVGGVGDKPAEPVPEGFEPPPDPQEHTRAGGMGRRRVIVHASGFEQSPYADIKPSGTGAAEAPRKLWHSSPGSSGR